MARHQSVFFSAARLLAEAMQEGGGAPTTSPRTQHLAQVRSRTAARGLVLSENVRQRGGRKSKRRTARTWEPA